MMRIASIAVGLALLAGCASWEGPIHGWVSPTATPEQALQDQRECDLQGMTATASIVNVWERGSRLSEIKRLCMETRGYAWGPLPTATTAAASP